MLYDISEILLPAGRHQNDRLILCHPERSEGSYI